MKEFLSYLKEFYHAGRVILVLIILVAFWIYWQSWKLEVFMVAGILVISLAETTYRFAEKRVRARVIRRQST